MIVAYPLSSTAQCSFPIGGDGSSISISNSIIIDGNMSDWSIFFNDPDNNTFDNTSGSDLDAPVADAGRDLTKFAFTEDANFLYIYLERAGSTNNATDILFYVDINNNDMMDLKEPVFHISWSGANGNAAIDVYDYNPYLLNSTYDQLSLNLDGKRLMGTLTKRSNSDTGNANDGCIGAGSANGLAIELKFPFEKITQLNLLNQVINQLSFGQDFRFHVSTINGSIGSVPGSNSINDNFGGCLKAPVFTLPVHLINFQGNVNKNNKIMLKWTVADNETAYSFEIERSIDGRDFKTTGIVFASEKRGTENYAFYDNINENDKVMYRLKMIDKNFSVNYSRILIFTTKSVTGNNIKIIGNPVNDKLVLSFTAANSEPATIKIYDVNGKNIMSSYINSYEGNNTISLTVSSHLTSGMYVVEVNNGTERLVGKFFKQ